MEFVAAAGLSHFAVDFVYLSDLAVFVPGGMIDHLDSYCLEDLDWIAQGGLGVVVGVG